MIADTCSGIAVASSMELKNSRSSVGNPEAGYNSWARIAGLVVGGGKFAFPKKVATFSGTTSIL